MQDLYRSRWVIFTLVAPGFIIFAFAILSPIILSFFFGLTRYMGIGSPVYIGFKNYIQIITQDEVFWRSLRNALILGAGLVLIQHPLSILFAVMVDRLEGGLERLFRAIIFVPCVISIVVTTRMWVNILDPDFGLLNVLLGKLGLESLQSAWLAKPELALASIVVICMWQGFGWAFLIYYSGLKGIPTELYEAGEIDGATGFKAYRFITIPMLKPVIQVNVTLAIVNALKQMETVYLSTNGGPADRTQFLANYLYTKAFSSYEYGYANAISVLFVAVCIFATYLTNRYIKSDY